MELPLRFSMFYPLCALHFAPILHSSPSLLLAHRVEFNGGDGTLFQCTDVVLVSDYSAPSNVTSSCQQAQKVTASSSGSSSSTTPSATASGATGATPSASGTSGAGKIAFTAAGGLLGFVGLVAVAL